MVLGKASAVDTFGEFGVLYHVLQPFTVRTTELSQILRVNKTSLMNVLQANPGDAQIIMDNLLTVIRILKALTRNTENKLYKLYLSLIYPSDHF